MINYTEATLKTEFMGIFIAVLSNKVIVKSHILEIIRNSTGVIRFCVNKLPLWNNYLEFSSRRIMGKEQTHTFLKMTHSPPHQLR